MRVTSSTLQRSDRPPRPLLTLWLFDESNRIGTGDAAPLPGFSPESVDACARALTGVEDRLGAIDDDAPPAEAISAALARFGRDLDAVPAARLALETALFDLVGLRRGLSLAACLGGPPSPARVPVNGLLLAPPEETLADRAAALAARGYSTLKIKLRARDEAGFLRELAALREVRDHLPLPVEIRLDPNAAWSLEEARVRLRALAVIAPAFVEQPVEATLLHRLGECAVPWAADESLLIPELIQPLLSARGCAAFVLKPALLGGLDRARALALQAQARGIDVVVTHLFDGPHSMAAAAELAVSLPRPPLACGLDRHDALEAWIADYGGLDIPQLAAPGWIQSSGGPGLGVSGYPIEHAWTR
jgi:L-alanine-DL-glutamate epimerase-like enolase superfamily enzyme